MLLEPLPPAEDEPWAGDLVQLHPGTLPGHPGATAYVVADIPSPGTLELNHQDQHHPDYWDWAAVTGVGAVATVTRLTPDGSRTWSLPVLKGGPR